MKLKKASQNITLMALMAAFNAIFALLMYLLPALSIILYLILPFITTLVVIKCSPRYLIIYYLASIAICFVINLQGLEYIIFTLIPSLITGTVFGVCLEKKLNIGLIIILSSFCQFAVSLLTLPLINLIYTNDEHAILEVFKVFLGAEREHLLYKIFLPLTFSIALAQNIISFLIVSSELSKFKIDINYDNKFGIAYSLINIGLMVLTILSAFFFDDLMYLFLAISIVLTALLVTSLMEQQKKILIVILGLSIIFILIGSIVISKINNLYVPLLVFFPIALITILQILTNKLTRTSKNVKLNEKEEKSDALNS